MIETSGHLPECPWADRGYAFPCICDRLRACEQRVRQDERAAALYAAREAVAALEPLLDVEKGMGGYDCCGCATVGYLWTDALAAIDALKEKP